jgi:hypothetical protein
LQPTTVAIDPNREDWPAGDPRPFRAIATANNALYEVKYEKPRPTI